MLLLPTSRLYLTRQERGQSIELDGQMGCTRAHVLNEKMIRSFYLNSTAALQFIDIHANVICGS